MYKILNVPEFLSLYFLCLTFYRFLILFIYIIDTGYSQVVFITYEELGKSYSETSTFKY